MSEITILKVNLQRATIYGEGASKYPNAKQKIYVIGKLSEPVIKNNKIILKEGRRVQIIFCHNNLKLALENIAKFDGVLSFFVDLQGDSYSATLDSDGNELPKFETDSLCEL